MVKYTRCKPLTRSRRAARASLLAATFACLLVWPAVPAAGQTQSQVDKHGEHQHADHSSHQQGHSRGPGPHEQQPFSGVYPLVKLRPIPDVEVVDQRDRRVRFYTDLVKGKVVAVGLFYTSCVNVCVDQGRVFSTLQAKLGERLGRDVHLILITMDPWVDTPARLKQWGERFKVKPGWTLVTGEPQAVESLAYVFGPQVLGRQEMHTSSVYVGNEPLKLWTFTSGFGPAESLLESIDNVARRKAGSEGRDSVPPKRQGDYHDDKGGAGRVPVVNFGRWVEPHPPIEVDIGSWRGGCRALEVRKSAWARCRPAFTPTGVYVQS